MKHDLLGLQAFVCVAEEGGFGRAAERLHLTQTAVSRRVQNLERGLGVRLLDRTTRRVAPTSVGRGFLARARRLVDELDDALVALREDARLGRGEVTIACVPSAAVQLLPRAIGQYAAAHPGNRVRVLDLSSAEVCAAVLENRAEFGITLLGAQPAGLATERLLRDPFVYACARTHPLALRAQVDWGQIERYPLIGIGRDSGNRAVIDRARGTGASVVRWTYEVQHVSTALGLVGAGAGGAVLPRLSVPAFAAGTIVLLQLRPALARDIGLVLRGGASLSPAAGRLLATVRSVVAARGGVGAVRARLAYSEEG